MSSASTSLLRDLGFTLGPAIVGAVALSRAATLFSGSLAASTLPAPVQAAAAAVAREGGPLAVNSVPPTSPPGGAAPLAVDALGTGYSIGYVVCGVAALVSCLLALLALRGGRSDTLVSAASLAEDVVEVPAHD
jgi:hypothetical protein